jgi:hypothetical protein
LALAALETYGYNPGAASQDKVTVAQFYDIAALGAATIAITALVVLFQVATAHKVPSELLQ